MADHQGWKKLYPHREPLVYLNEKRRRELVRLTNKVGETPLHMAVRAQGRGGIFSGTVRQSLSNTTASIFDQVGDEVEEVRMKPGSFEGRKSKPTKVIKQLGSTLATMTMNMTMSKKSCVVAVQVWRFFVSIND